MIQDQDTMYMHFRPRNYSDAVTTPRGGATVAMRHETETVVKLAVAWCSKNDVFNRKMGRAISGGRLSKASADSEKIVTLCVDPTQSTKDQVAAYLSEDMAEFGYR